MGDEPPLTPLRRILETIAERAKFALQQLDAFEEVRAMAWRCRHCRHVKKFTRKVPAETAAPCPKCRGGDFEVER